MQCHSSPIKSTNISCLQNWKHFSLWYPARWYQKTFPIFHVSPLLDGAAFKNSSLYVAKVVIFFFEGEKYSEDSPLYGRACVCQPRHQAPVNSWEKTSSMWMAVEGGEGVITCSTVCFFAPRTPHLCIVEWNNPTLVRRRLSLTHAGLRKEITDGIKLKWLNWTES